MSGMRLTVGYNAMQTATIVQVKGRKVKVDVDGTISKWKDGSCMVKLPD